MITFNKYVNREEGLKMNQNNASDFFRFFLWVLKMEIRVSYYSDGVPLGALEGSEIFRSKWLAHLGIHKIEIWEEIIQGCKK